MIAPTASSSTVSAWSSSIAPAGQALHARLALRADGAVEAAIRLRDRLFVAVGADDLVPASAALGAVAKRNGNALRQLLARPAPRRSGEPRRPSPARSRAAARRAGSCESSGRPGFRPRSPRSPSSRRSRPRRRPRTPRPYLSSASRGRSGSGPSRPPRPRNPRGSRATMSWPIASTTLSASSSTKSPSIGTGRRRPDSIRLAQLAALQLERRDASLLAHDLQRRDQEFDLQALLERLLDVLGQRRHLGSRPCGRQASRRALGPRPSADEWRCGRRRAPRRRRRSRRPRSPTETFSPRLSSRRNSTARSVPSSSAPGISTSLDFCKPTARKAAP